jgi:isopropylmalate/homocitrate/citramalate synthase
VNVAFAGLGERTGNTSMEQMVASYIRLYGDPGFNLQVLPEMKRLIEPYVPLAANSPVIGEVFTTQAGIHQAGVARQEDAPGGLIYLAYDPALVGQTGVERTVIGAMSGAEGIVAILNAEAQRRGVEARFTTMSRVVKEIYDRVQEAYDGQWDDNEGRWAHYRTTFFTPEEIWKMASASPAMEGA